MIVTKPGRCPKCKGIHIEHHVYFMKCKDCGHLETYKIIGIGNILNIEE